MSADLKHIAQTAIEVDDTTTFRDVTSDFARVEFKFVDVTIPPCSPHYFSIHSLPCCRSFHLLSLSLFTSSLMRGWQTILATQHHAFKDVSRSIPSPPRSYRHPPSVIAGFGWGKPVEFDPYNLKRPQRDTALIALAGPGQ